MQKDIKKQLHDELDRYLQGDVEFPPYYPGMPVLSSDLYRKQLKEAIELTKNQTDIETKSFELYLDTIIINMHTKLRKYKNSIYFDDENIKEIENQGFTIPFYIDEANSLVILLGIFPGQRK